jgi:hypothetical protein
VLVAHAHILDHHRSPADIHSSARLGTEPRWTSVTLSSSLSAANQDALAAGVEDYRYVGIEAEMILVGERVRRLSDPDGGSFDAAGDFDRLVPSAGHAFALLGRVDAHGETCFEYGEMEQLVAEIDLLLSEARPGPEYRGLMRLRVMALRCAREHGKLVFLGD